MHTARSWESADSYCNICVERIQVSVKRISQNILLILYEARTAQAKTLLTGRPIRKAQLSLGAAAGWLLRTYEGFRSTWTGEKPDPRISLAPLGT